MLKQTLLHKTFRKNLYPKQTSFVNALTKPKQGLNGFNHFKSCTFWEGTEAIKKKKKLIQVIKTNKNYKKNLYRFKLTRI